MRIRIFCGLVSPAPVFPANLALPFPAAPLTEIGTFELVELTGPGR